MDHTVKLSDRSAHFRNPLAGLSRQELQNHVEDFIRTSGLDEDRALFSRAAVLAQTSEQYETLEELERNEKELLVQEAAH